MGRTPLAADFLESHARNVAIDINKEVPVLLADLGKQLHTPVSYRTVYGWCEFGVLPRDGSVRICLESIDMPSGLCSSIEAYHRFIRRLNGCDE